MSLEREYRLGWASQWARQWEMGTSACSREYWWLVARRERTLRAASGILPGAKWWSVSWYAKLLAAPSSGCPPNGLAHRRDAAGGASGGAGVGRCSRATPRHKQNHSSNLLTLGVHLDGMQP